MRKLVPVALMFALTACTITVADRVKGFEREADELRQTLHIPGMSAVIVKDQKVNG